MRAFVRERYGPPDVIEVREVDEPSVAEDEVLVRVRAVSVNPAEWFAVTGTPTIVRPTYGLRRPKNVRIGVDFAGVVEGVGRGVTRFRTGDEMFGAKVGAFAELVAIAEDSAIAPKPANVTFEQAAAVPTAAATALQALRDEGGIRPGHAVLINGASGGVGTFAVQIAKALGGEVTGVCRMENVELVRSLGADHVVDYTREDFGQTDRRYDLVVDIAGSRPWSAYRRVLDPDGTFVIVGGQKTSRLLGPLTHVLTIKLASLGSGRKVVFFIASFEQEDFLLLRDLIEAGSLTPAIDRTFDVDRMREAFAYLGDGHARAKVVVSLWS